DLTVCDGDIALETPGAGTVDDGAVPHDQIVLRSHSSASPNSLISSPYTARHRLAKRDFGATRQSVRSGAATHQPARPRARCGIVLARHHAADHRRQIAFAVLQQTAAALGQ